MNRSPALALRGQLAAGIFALVALAGTARADVITLDTAHSPLGPDLNQGWWDSEGTHISSNANTATSLNNNGLEYRSFYIFDLTPLGGQTASSVSLRIFNSSSNFSSGLPPWSVEFYDVTSNVDSVKNGDVSATIFTDLGSGTFYGASTFSAVDNYVTFDLNANALAALNAQGTGYFAIGAKLLTPNTAFGYTFGDVTYLDVTVGTSVPETGATFALVALGCGGLALLRRTRQLAQKSN